VDEAQSTKAPIQCTADRIIPWFVSITLLLASLTFLFWFSEDFEIALMAATSVLIITCPCAFGLATPMAIAVATGVGARMGVLVKHGAVLEILSSVRHFVFDKTGTLTQGKMQVSTFFSVAVNEKDNGNAIKKMIPDKESIESLSAFQKKLLIQAYLLESHSEHIIAKAIVNFSKQFDLATEVKKNSAENINNLTEELQFLPLEEIKVVSGSGIRAKIQGKTIAIGSQSWISQLMHDSLLDQEFLQQKQHLDDNLKNYYLSGSMVVYAWLENEGIIAYIIEDKLRENATHVVQQMHNQNFILTLLSGDKKEVAEYMAKKLDIEEVIAEVMPDDKDAVIQNKQAQGNLIAMVGDGINDAPSLVRADVGIAMGTGTDVSIDSADIILINGELEKIPVAAELSRATLSTIKQNISISILYNLIMVPLAMAAMITPLVAAISMPLSSLLVIANAARLRWRFIK
jgi:P-type Cu2+ transporter